MYNLAELGLLLARRDQWGREQVRHQDILVTIQAVAKTYSIAIPGHW
jgi:hypothetical protein